MSFNQFLSRIWVHIPALCIAAIHTDKAATVIAQNKGVHNKFVKMNCLNCDEIKDLWVPFL